MRSKQYHFGSLEQVVLTALLRLGERAYGMKIQEEIEVRTGRSLSLGALYTTLERLEAKGFISSRLGEATPERGGRAKKYFRIEAPGRKAIYEARHMMERMWDGIPSEA